MIEVKAAQYIDDYSIKLEFSNGRVGTANLKETIFNDHREIFSKLKDILFFKNFEIAHSTVTWSSEIDLASEYLFFLAFRDASEFQEQFLKWGYIS